MVLRSPTVHANWMILKVEKSYTSWMVWKKSEEKKVNGLKSPKVTNKCMIWDTSNKSHNSWMVRKSPHVTQVEWIEQLPTLTKPEWFSKYQRLQLLSGFLFAVFLLCVQARDCSRSNETMGCAHTWMWHHVMWQVQQLSHHLYVYVQVQCSVDGQAQTLLLTRPIYLPCQHEAWWWFWRWH